MIVYLNGEWLDDTGAGIAIGDAGFLAGDGVFETALLHDGGFLHLQAHLRRFAESAAVMRLTAPTTEELDAMVRELVHRNRLRHASIRMTLTRGTATPTLLLTARPPSRAWADRARRGWRIMTARTTRPSTTAVPAQLKAIGRTYALLARHEAAEAGVDDALLLTDGGEVCEGPSWNIFWRQGRIIRTPALHLGVLAGVTRSTILGLARDAGWEMEEGTWPRAELDAADEIMATMTSVGVVSIRSLDKRTLTETTPAADVLRALYHDYVASATAADPA